MSPAPERSGTCCCSAAQLRLHLLPTIYSDGNQTKRVESFTGITPSLQQNWDQNPFVFLDVTLNVLNCTSRLLGSGCSDPSAGTFHHQNQSEPQSHR